MAINERIFIADEAHLEGIVTKCIKEALENVSRLALDHPPCEIVDGKTLMKRLDISEPTLQRWRDRRRIPYIQEDSIVRYNWPKVLEALEKRKGGKK